MSQARVMITGAGPVSAVGSGWDALRAALAGGRSGIGEVTLFDPEPHGHRLAAELHGFRVEDYLRSPKSYLDRASEIAFAAAELALRDAALDPAAPLWADAGLALGTALGALGTAHLFFDGFLAKGPRLVKPVLFPNTYSNTAISLLAIEYRIGGPHLNVASGFVSAAAALTAAFDWIRLGKAQVVLAGGVDALGEAALAGCAQAGWLSPADGGEEACRPFDRRGNGFVLGEGGGLLVLEAEEHARARGARCRGELLGAAIGATVAGRTTPADVSAALLSAMEQALAQAGCAPAAVAGVLAAANGSPAGDRAEADALATLLAGAPAPVPVSALKALTGETLGAAAALGVIAACVACETGVLPAAAGDGEPELPPGLCVAGAAVPRPLRTLLVNAADPGGAVASLVIGKGPA